MYSLYPLLGVMTTLNKNFLFASFAPVHQSENDGAGLAAAGMNISSSQYGGGKQTHKTKKPRPRRVPAFALSGDC
jgi:hypothetical protein